MRIVFVGIFTIMSFILGMSLIEITEKKSKINFSVIKLIVLTIFASVLQVVFYNTLNASFLEIVYSIYYVIVDLILYFMFLVAMNLTEYEAKKEKLFRAIKIVLFVDIVALLSNNVYPFMFKSVNKVSQNGELYLVDDFYLPYRLHLYFNYFLMAFVIYIFLRAIFHSKGIYQKHYIILLGSFSLIPIFTFLYENLLIRVDFSIVGYNLMTIFVYYLTHSYSPLVIVDKMLANIITNEFDAILFFDLDGKCVYMNESGKAMFEVEGDDFEGKNKEIYQFIDFFHFDKENDANIASHGMEVNGELRYYELEYKRIKKGNRYIGSYYRIKDRTDYKKALDEERYLANHDSLTGLYNREYFYKKVLERLNTNPDQEYYIVATDIKGFKLINDIFGDDAGDQVLIDVAEALKEVTSPSTLYCRLTGDKFCALVEKENLLEERIIALQEKVPSVRDKDYPVIIQVGIYKIVNPKIPISVMADRAYLAIAENKEDYHNRIYYYNDKIKHRRYWEQKLSGELELAILDGQLKVFLQPQCDKDGKVMGAEALIRWNHPTEGLIPPIKFIEMFEKNGMISKLDKFVWKTVSDVLNRWEEMGKEHLYISVNISPIDFYFMNIYEEFKKLITENNIFPKRLKLEITESAMIRDMDRKLKVIEDLRKLGFIVEMDDFGSGYSSLNMLKEIPVDIIKLDMGFLYKTKDENKSYRIIEMIVELSQDLGMQAVSEGVETEEQLNFLAEIGCECFQGYYFSKPLDIETFEKLYLS